MNKVKKILILSDTHGDETLYKQIIKNEEADIVIHAGDYSDTKSRLSFDKNDFISNVDYYIEGNHGIKNENFELIQEIKDNKNEKEQFYFSKFSEDYKIFEINGKCFFLVHVYISEDDDWDKEIFNKYKEHINSLIIKNKIDYVIYGHTHRLSIKQNKNIIEINPGSLIKPKRQKSGSYIIGVWENNTFKFTPIYL